MRNIKKMHSILITVILCLILASCNNGPTDQGSVELHTPPEVLIEAESYNDSEGMFQEHSNGNDQIMVHSETEGWLAFDVDIPVAGRYRSQIRVRSASDSNSVFWIEDYYDNKDDRTYNITGIIPCENDDADSMFILYVDGTPLNAGLHKMKLHIGSGKMEVDWIKFTLLRPHMPTPKIMTQNTSGDEWKVVWSDEFEGTGLPDTTKWLFDIGNWGWGNFELQYYTDRRPENARLENGCLVIEAHKNDMGHPWTSARLTTRSKVSFLYGKIEFRAKVPPKRGNWAAGWTLGDEYVDELSWPYCGEIDILESVGYEMDDESGHGKAHASIHCGAYYFKLNNQPTSTIDVENMKDEFHTYAVEWYPGEIRAYVDGQHYLSYNDASSELSWPFDKPQNIILNLAMGGGWGGAMGMDESMTSQKFIIDYVRVYELR